MSRASSRILFELALLSRNLARDCERRAKYAEKPSEAAALAKVAREAADSARESLALKALFDREAPPLGPRRPRTVAPAPPAPKDVH